MPGNRAEKRPSSRVLKSCQGDALGIAKPMPTEARQQQRMSWEMQRGQQVVQQRIPAFEERLQQSSVRGSVLPEDGIHRGQLSLERQGRAI
jgi:hypothetical protein